MRSTRGQLTKVTSVLIRPSGEPWANQRVQVDVHAPLPWTVYGERLMPYATTNTNDKGEWELDLVPNVEIDPDGNSWYVARVPLGMHAGWQADELSRDAFVVPVSTVPVSLYDYLIDVPPPPPFPIVIARLGDLHNVDVLANTAPVGHVLATTGSGVWSIVGNKLAVLGDVDESVNYAEAGDQLVCVRTGVGGPVWGTTRGKPPTLKADIETDPDVVRGVIVHVTLSDGVHKLTMAWDDGTPLQTYTAETVEIKHTYGVAGSYNPILSYEDDSESVLLEITVT